MTKSGGLICVGNVTRATCLGDRIRVADRGWDRSIGLLGRQSLECGSGLFIVPTQAVHTFFMRFPIDLVFVDKRFKVVGIRRNLRPWRMSRIYWRALGVLELPSGTVEETQTNIGDQLRMVDIDTGASITS